MTLVEDAATSGRIVQADRDMRIAQLKGATSMQDIDLVVRDLRPPGVATPPAFPAAPPTATGHPPWPINYGPAPDRGVQIATVVTKTGGRAIGGIIAAVVLVSIVVPIAGAVIAFASNRDSFPDFGDIGPTDDTTYLPGEAPGEDGVNVHTVEGFEELVDAIEEEKGDAYVYDAVIYPRYAVAELPTGKNNRYQNFYWDGRELSVQDFKGLATGGQVDLSLIEPQRVIDLLVEVRGRVEDPESWYVIIAAPSGAGGQISAYASNDFGENAYLVSTLDGTITYDSQTS
jgi:hypothetical protein